MIIRDILLVLCGQLESREDSGFLVLRLLARATRDGGEARRSIPVALRIRRILISRNRLFVVDLDVVVLDIVGDCEHVARLPTDRVTHLLALVNLLEVLVVVLLLDREQIVFKVAESVGLEVGKVNNVVLMFKLVAET